MTQDDKRDILYIIMLSINVYRQYANKLLQKYLNSIWNKECYMNQSVRAMDKTKKSGHEF